MVPRYKKWRYCHPFKGDAFYKPRGVPLAASEIIELQHDEFEAMRLCDSEELDQEKAGEKMGVSRGTIQRLLYSGRKKVIEALGNSKAIKLVGHEFILPLPRFGFGRGRRRWCHRGW